MRVALVLAGLLAALGIGFIAFGRFVDDFALSLGLQAAWFAAVAGVAVVLARRSSGLMVPVVGTLAVCAAAGAAVFYWTTIRDETVNETVVTGVKASDVRTAHVTPSTPEPATRPTPKVNVEQAAGTFASLAHETTGSAALIDLAEGGRRLTITDLNTANGPDLRVYLVPGGSNAQGSVEGGTSLGRLKGNIGTQQYEVPERVRLTGGASVVIWCRAFTVAFGVAQLARS